MRLLPNRFMTVTLIAVLTSGVFGAEVPVPSDVQQRLDAQDQRLAQQDRLIAEQRAQLARLLAASEDTWLTERRAEEVKALVRDVLADAETRASFAEGGMTAGHNGSFFLASEDGSFLLKIAGMLQARYNFSHREGSTNDGDRGGFEMARTRFGFIGHVIDPTWKFVLWTGHHYNGDSLLLDAYITKDLGGGWSVTAGQFKNPFWREWLVSETRQQFVERSQLAGAFAGSYTQGVKIGYAGERCRGEFAFTDGITTMNKSWNTEDTEYALAARGELLLTGSWKQHAEFESWQNEEPSAVFGMAVHHQMNEYGTTTDEHEITRATADLSIEFGGANLFAAVIAGRDQNGSTFDQLGALVQGGVFVTEKLELIARYEWGDSDSGGDDKLSVLTVGGNYFFARHALRLTMDVGYSFEPIGAFWTNNFAGYQTDAAGESGQIVIRSQFQLLF